MNAKCTTCGQSLDIADDLAGLSIQCPACGRFMTAPSAAQAPQRQHVARTSVTMPPPQTSHDTIQNVAIVDVHMPLSSMVIFMIKWAIAAIPAAMILFALYLLVASIFLGGCAVLTMRMP